MSTHRLHDHAGDDLGTIEHPAPNVERGDVVALEDGPEGLVTARVETNGGTLAALWRSSWPLLRRSLTSPESVIAASRTGSPFSPATCELAP